MTVFSGNIVFGQTVVGLERRINAVESGAGSIVVSEEAAVNSYPLRSGPIDRVVAAEHLVFDVSMSPVTGYGLISVFDPAAGVDDFLQLWDDQSPGELIWSIDADSNSTFRGVDQDRGRNVYAVSVGDTTGIQKYNSSQTKQWTTTEWVEGEDTKTFVEPEGCALTNDEQSIWVMDSARARAEKFAASTGAHLAGFDLEDSGGRRITIAPNGKIYVTHGSNIFFTDQRIVRYSSNGTFETEWGSDGTGVGQFERLVAVTSSPNHNVIFVLDHLTAGAGSGRVQAFDASGALLWTRAVNGELSGAGIPPGTGGVAFGFGSQTEWFYYPTEFTAQRVSAGPPNGGFSVPAANFYDNKIIRPNIVADMQAAIEVVALNYVNGLTGNPFNWDSSDPDNLYTVAVDFTKDDWNKPTKEALAGTAIRPDEYNEIDLCLDVLEVSFPI